MRGALGSGGSAVSSSTSAPMHWVRVRVRYTVRFRVGVSVSVRVRFSVRFRVSVSVSVRVRALMAAEQPTRAGK